MHVSALPMKTQDYLKIIWDILERTGEPATMGAIAESMGQKASTTTEGIKRLVEKGLVTHEPYSGIGLTDEGKTLALTMARRHRLLETYLVQCLGYSWDEVHLEADQLEHAVSDTFIERIDAQLGHPTRDPHGDPIPTANGEIEMLSRTTLAALEPGHTAVIERVHDSNSELLRYLQQHGVAPGVRVARAEAPFAGMSTISVGDRQVSLTDAALAAIDIRI